MSTFYIFYNISLLSMFYLNGITLPGIILIATPQDHSKTLLTLNHEAIHARQIKKLGVIPFYFKYFKEYCCNYRLYKEHYLAYINIK